MLANTTQKSLECTYWQLTMATSKQLILSFINMAINNYVAATHVSASVEQYAGCKHSHTTILTSDAV